MSEITDVATTDRANIAASYRWRMLFVSVFCFGFASWCAYDGAIGYPAKRARWDKYEELIETDRLDDWEKIADANGWPLKVPNEHDDMKGPNDYLVQYMMGGMIGAIGIPFLFIFVSTRGRWIEMDDDGLSTSWGVRCDFDDITGLDKTKWYKKGIAVVHFEKDGRKGSITLDDCKYDREPTEIFVRDVELEIDPEQVIGKRAPEPNDDENEEGDDQVVESVGDDA
jgi:hypothetical protein